MDPGSQIRGSGAARWGETFEPLILSATVLVIIPRSPTKIISFNPYWRCKRDLLRHRGDLAICSLIRRETVCPVFSYSAQPEWDVFDRLETSRQPKKKGKNLAGLSRPDKT
jgi:hypothetical protein